MLLSVLSHHLRNHTDKVTFGDSNNLKLSADFCKHANLSKGIRVLPTSLIIYFGSPSNERYFISW